MNLNEVGLDEVASEEQGTDPGCVFDLGEDDSEDEGSELISDFEGKNEDEIVGVIPVLYRMDCSEISSMVEDQVNTEDFTATFQISGTNPPVFGDPKGKEANGVGSVGKKPTLELNFDSSGEENMVEEAFEKEPKSWAKVAAGTESAAQKPKRHPYLDPGLTLQLPMEIMGPFWESVRKRRNGGKAKRTSDSRVVEGKFPSDSDRLWAPREPHPKVLIGMD
ncbi:hypothetical protein U1Q18_032702 [Sarracenia purpurea var. burkii]